MTNEYRKIGEDKYSEHWSMGGSAYVEVPKGVIEAKEREWEKPSLPVILFALAGFSGLLVACTGIAAFLFVWWVVS